MNEIVLRGCRPETLMGYLKALGVLRILSEQLKEHTVKGFWRNGTFVIHSSCDAQFILDFFRDKYVPTPIVAPWGGGSGFYPGDAQQGIGAIERSTDGRLSAYREIIAAIRTWPEISSPLKCVADIVSAIKNEASVMRPGKARTLYETLLKTENGYRGKVEMELGLSDLIDTPMDGLGQFCKDLEGAQKKAANNWHMTVKKLRTKCVGLARGENKEALLKACRTRLPDECLSWLDAVYLAPSNSVPIYNPLLGTGANDGNCNFSNNFMQHIANLLIAGACAESRSLFESSIMGTPVSGLIESSIGQYNPGRAGGYNQGMGIEKKNFKINPWDFVLLLEGSIAMTGSIARRFTDNPHGFESLPFTVRPIRIGYSSATQDEDCRAEIWLPMWKRPSSYAEFRHLAGEGRCSIGRRQAPNGLEFTRAIGMLGVDRGIEGFSRYLLLKRRGKSYIALNAGYMPVQYRPALRLLDELDPIIWQLDKFLRGFNKKIPATFVSARRRIEVATFQLCQKPDPASFSGLVQALGNMEYLIAQRDRSAKINPQRPLGGLSPMWILESDDGSLEIRIAAAIASVRCNGLVGTVRSNMSRVDAQKPWTWASGQSQQHWHGSNLVERLSGVVRQRMMDAERLNTLLPFSGSVSLSPKDVVSFLYGDTDDRKIEYLLWGMTLIDWGKPGLDSLRGRWSGALHNDPLPRGWCLLKLLHSYDFIRGVEIRKDPRSISLLAAGRGAESIQAALHRVRVSGLMPLPVNQDEQINTQRQLAALIIPTNDQGLLESLVLEDKK
ncbi:MAG: type I-U CRISPR-associated protein Csx17 [Deltaproteobacteria bacterium]